MRQFFQSGQEFSIPAIRQVLPQRGWILALPLVFVLPPELVNGFRSFFVAHLPILGFDAESS
jgi:hypothetical protein